MNTPRFLSLWAINGPLDRGRLRRQIDRLHAAGLDGVVFHPRFYPGRPPYLSTAYLADVSDLILYAKAKGLAFWIYDENGWPSGTVSGQLLEAYPELGQRWAELSSEPPEVCLAEFDHEGRHWFVAERRGAGVDYLNPGLAPRFLQLTHERYRTGLDPEAFDHVEAIFCDEPEFGLGHARGLFASYGAIPWTDDLPQAFARSLEVDLISLLPDIFFTTPRSASARIRFWEFLRDRFCAGFLAPIDAWCRQYGKWFTAHVKGEEHPLFQVPMVGSCDAVYRSLGLPGIDALERFPANDYYPRQVSTAAWQFGTGRCMVEAFGGAGWGAGPADLEGYLMWLARNGLTDFVLHLSQYRLDSTAITDWPPSQPLHLSWTEAYSSVLQRVRERLASAPTVPADTLVVSPHRAIMAAFVPAELGQMNNHNGSAYLHSVAGGINRRFLRGIAALEATGARWHVVDEATFQAHSRVTDHRVVLGHCSYTRVLVAAGADLPGSWDQLPDGIPDVPAAAPSAAPAAEVPFIWTLVSDPVNALRLEARAEEGGWYECDVPCMPEGTAAEVIFADDLMAATADGRPLTLRPIEDGTALAWPGDARILRFRRLPAAEEPFVWLHGAFGVHAPAGFETVEDRERVAGPFLLRRLPASPDWDLIRAGFPFLRNGLKLVATFRLPSPLTGFNLTGTAAAAARVTIDGKDCGWIWGPDWVVPVPLEAGSHELELELVPSGFNYYGPHHHYLGDRPVVSPGQFHGRKNFADRADAPERTRVAAWHFVPFRAPLGLSIRPQQDPEPGSIRRGGAAASPSKAAAANGRARRRTPA